MQATSVIAVLIVVVFSTTVHADDPCLHFEPAVVSLTGKLVRQTFASPPNFESIPTGDTAETYWFIELATPACVSGNPADIMNRADALDVKMVQLVLSGDQYATHSSLVGKAVTATGSLFSALSGHHHTQVLLRSYP